MWTSENNENMLVVDVYFFKTGKKPFYFQIYGYMSAKP